jgi:hypothetical protein
VMVVVFMSVVVLGLMLVPMHRSRLPRARHHAS